MVISPAVLPQEVPLPDENVISVQAEEIPLPGETAASVPVENIPLPDETATSVSVEDIPLPDQPVISSPAEGTPLPEAPIEDNTIVTTTVKIVEELPSESPEKTEALSEDRPVTPDSKLSDAVSALKSGGLPPSPASSADGSPKKSDEFPPSPAPSAKEELMEVEKVNPALGMLAVGLGSAEVAEYISDFADSVQIGCLNSPNSVTLSGEKESLEKVKARLEEAGYFARLLQVDFAYHSKYMKDAALVYEDLLKQYCEPPLAGKEGVSMYSSVTGYFQDGVCDATYWKTNMTSQVRFDSALREMIAGRDGSNFLIEIGPSGALAGPIAQIKKELGDAGSNVQYFPASSRGKDSLTPLFKVAGQLFISGGSVDLAKVNQAQEPAAPRPSIIVDLPNYSWNHSTKYWHESDASKDWRFRKFPHHDLLGSKVLGTSWNSPSFKKVLKLEHLGWLKDHRVSYRN